MAPMKRVYYFTPPEFALENLQNERLKVSRFSRCNDAFELASLGQRNKAFRKKFRKWLLEFDKRSGLLCFCRSWKNTVMWAHYADNHTGLCYGFDVDSKTFVNVQYVSERLYPNLTPDNFLDHVGEDQMIDLFATKFIHWSYEEEVRLLVPFSESVPVGEKLFHDFSASMVLKEVIVGPKSTIKASTVNEVVNGKGVSVFQSRLAFTRFEITRQKNKAFGGQGSVSS